MAFSKLQTKLGTKSMLKKQKKNQEDLEVCVGADLNFAGAEAFKLLRTNISFSFPDASGCRIIGVTSSVRGEGKTLISLNLAYSIAQQNENRVLLIEGDMRLPTFSKKTDLKPTPGLSNLFAGMAFEDAVQHFADRMDVLSCGDIPPNPSELLSSQKMEAMLQDFANRYDFIIVDLPPVIDVSDALAVSKYLDGMILVVRQNYVPKALVAQAISRFEVAKAKVIGAVFNTAYERSGKGSKYYGNKKYYAKHYHSYYSSYAKAGEEWKAAQDND
jgi:capsular exopolysaccharide synthesis family protein